MRIITKSENIQPTKTLLSVCIPSYNQLEELEETLLEIESQLREGSLPLEVLVSDNKSQNRAEVGNLKRRFSSYRWFLQESNLGFRGNLSFLANAAKSPYVWFIGCGDKPSPGSLAQTINKIAELQRPSLLAFATTYRSKEVARSEYVSPVSWREVGCSSKGLWYESSFNSMLFPRKEYLQATARDNISGDSWPHLEALLKMHALGIPILRSSSKLVVHDDKPGGWWKSDAALQVTIDEARLLYKFQDHRCTPALRHLLNHCISNLPMAFLGSTFSLKERDRLRGLSAVLSAYRGGFLLVALMAWLAPRLVLRAVSILRRSS